MDVHNFAGPCEKSPRSEWVENNRGTQIAMLKLVPIGVIVFHFSVIITLKIMHTWLRSDENPEKKKCSPINWKVRNKKSCCECIIVAL